MSRLSGRFRRPSSPVRDRLVGDLRDARRLEREGDLDASWALLEGAHVLSQPWATWHVRVHLAMLAVGTRQRDGREVTGQLIRLVVAGPGSLTGRYPLGNTGRARVPATQPMPMPDDLRELLDASGRPG